MPFQPRKLSFVGIAFVLALLLSASSLAPHRASAQTAQAATPTISGAAHFIQIATSSNTLGDFTLLNNIATNNLPNAILFVTSNVSPFAVPHTSDPHPVGLWYDTGVNEWGIFNEDQTSMPLGAAFSVLVVPKAGGSVFVQTAAPFNSSGDSTFLNNVFTNGQPAAQLLITQNWNPGGVGGAYNPHNVGVWYSTGAKQWTIFNEDQAKMPSTNFNVMVGAGASGGGTELLQTVTSSNRSGDSTSINNTATNNLPNAILFVTPNFNPGSISGTYDPHPVGVRYDTGSGQWAILNEDGASMPLSAAFNILAFAS